MYHSRYSTKTLDLIASGCRPFHDDLILSLVEDLTAALYEIDHLRAESAKHLDLAVRGTEVHTKAVLDLILLSDKPARPA